MIFASAPRADRSSELALDNPGSIGSPMRSASGNSRLETSRDLRRIGMASSIRRVASQETPRGASAPNARRRIE